MARYSLKGGEMSTLRKLTMGGGRKRRRQRTQRRQRRQRRQRKQGGSLNDIMTVGSLLTLNLCHSSFNNVII